MPIALNRRWVMATLTVFTTTVVVLAAFFVWPGVVLPGCRSYSGPTEVINDRPYCYATVRLPTPYSVPFANYTVWGFTFQLYYPASLECPHMFITVEEPNGTSTLGVISSCARVGPSLSWFASDNESGVIVLNGSAAGQLTLLVEQESGANSPSCPLELTTNSRRYCSEVVPLVGNSFCNGVADCVRPPPVNFTFHGIDFYLNLDNASTGPEVWGKVTEYGVHYGVDMLDVTLGQSYFNWTSPDQRVFIGWQTPFVTTGPNGWMGANVTCGVELG